MEIKHKRVFQPTAIEVWGLDSVAETYCAIAESINLYSVLRGINRFEGLALAFERLAQQSEEGRRRVDGYLQLQGYVLSGRPLHFDAIADYNESRKFDFLDKVLEWSRRCDDLYGHIMASEGNSPFPGVVETLGLASSQAEIAVISSSSRVTLEKDWGDAGLLPFLSRIEGQEQGDKSSQLESAIREERPPSRSLMIGDAPGDLEAAREHGILFYPIIPGDEVRSWERFKSEGLTRFYNGSYAGGFEQELINEFENVLQPDVEIVPPSYVGSPA